MVNTRLLFVKPEKGLRMPREDAPESVPESVPEFAPKVFLRTIEEVIRAGKATVSVTVGKETYRQPSPYLLRLVDTKAGKAAAAVFIIKARGDSVLKQLCEQQGIDLEEWADGLENT